MVTSNALGGGFELALATHLRIFTNVATVGFPETRLGIIPGAGGTYRLRHLVGESKAYEMVLTGRNIQGQQAYEWGICNWCVNTDKRSPDQNGVGNETGDAQPKPITKTGSFDYKDGGDRRSKAVSFALEVAKSICEGAPMAVAAALHSVKAATPGVEALMYNTCMTLGAEDRAEGLRAFKEKRSPLYKGARRDSENAKAVKGMIHEEASEKTESQLPGAEGGEEVVEDPEGAKDLEMPEDSERSETLEASDVHGEFESDSSETSEGEVQREKSTTRDKERQD